MKDFTLNKYEYLLDVFINEEYKFQTFKDYVECPAKKSVILRHDIDLKRYKALDFAKLENRKGIIGTYYFRSVPFIFDKELIKQVIQLGHEIGYHYEDLSMHSGSYQKAIESFEKNLNSFKELYDVKTISMHGRSISRFDNKDLWNKYDYRNFGIIAEPYIDLDFDKILYLTDSAQRWNGSNISIRDKVKSKFKFSFKTTDDIINNVKQLPDHIMLTFHPDRWTNNILEWYKIQTIVRMKNFVKQYFLKNRHSFYEKK